jgi:hypothetical protein
MQLYTPVGLLLVNDLDELHDGDLVGRKKRRVTRLVCPSSAAYSISQASSGSQTNSPTSDWTSDRLAHGLEFEGPSMVSDNDPRAEQLKIERDR